MLNEEGLFFFFFTFVDFIILSVHLSLQDVALNQALHDILRGGQERSKIK